MKTKLRSTVRKMVREEFGKRIQAETEGDGEVKPRFGKVWDTIPATKRDDFGRWVKAHFGTKIPSSVEDKVVVEFLDKNPSATRMSPVQLVDMFIKMPSIKSGLSAIGDEDIAHIGNAITAGSRYQHGDTSLAAAGDTIGVSSQGAKLIGQKGVDYVKKFYDGEHPESLSDEDFSDMFGKGGKFDAAVNTAADMYARMLKASDGDVDKMFKALEGAGVLQSKESELLSDAERVAVQHLAELASEGKLDVVKHLLKKDLDKPIEDANIVKSFQNLVSKIVRKDLDALDIAAGVKKSRGRPKGSKNK